jgi:hypothetical protein
MEKEERRFAMKFLWLKGWSAKRIHEELMSTFGNSETSLNFGDAT